MAISLIPTKDCCYEIGSQVNTYANKGDIDIIHVIQDGHVVGWMDYTGALGGTLANGGAGSDVFINGVQVTDPNFKAGTNVTLVKYLVLTVTVYATGSQGPPGTSQLPWIDIQAYGSIASCLCINQSTAGCTTASGSP